MQVTNFLAYLFGKWCQVLFFFPFSLFFGDAGSGRQGSGGVALSSGYDLM